MTTTEAARVLRLSKNHVQYLARDGEIKARKDGPGVGVRRGIRHGMEGEPAAQATAGNAVAERDGSRQAELEMQGVCTCEHAAERVQ